MNDKRIERGYELMLCYADMVGAHKDFSQFEACDPIVDILHYITQHDGISEAVFQHGNAFMHLDAEVNGES